MERVSGLSALMISKPRGNVSTNFDNVFDKNRKQRGQ